MRRHQARGVGRWAGSHGTSTLKSQRPACPCNCTTGASRARKALREISCAPRLLRWAKRKGIRTILNLRGRRDDCGSYILEREACRKLGLTLIDFPIRSRSPLDKETILAAGKIFETIEYPVLMHCKSGSDRAGFMATLYLFAYEGQPLDQAMKQLSWKYGHFKQAKTGILDYFFELYAAYNQKRPIAFWDWVERVYDPVEAKASFRSREWADAVVDRVLGRE